MSYEKNQKNRDRIARRRKEMTGEVFRMKYCTPLVVSDLKSKPHPKLPDSKLTEWDYVNWLIKNGYSHKAWPIIEPLSELYKEAYDEHRVSILERERDDYGIPRTYR